MILMLCVGTYMSGFPEGIYGYILHFWLAAKEAARPEKCWGALIRQNLYDTS
jgi:hypothetical protein